MGFWTDARDVLVDRSPVPGRLGLNSVVVDGSRYGVFGMLLWKSVEAHEKPARAETRISQRRSRPPGFAPPVPATRLPRHHHCTKPRTVPERRRPSVRNPRDSLPKRPQHTVISGRRQPGSVRKSRTTSRRPPKPHYCAEPDLPRSTSVTDSSAISAGSRNHAAIWPTLGITNRKRGPPPRSTVIPPTRSRA